MLGEAPHYFKDALTAIKTLRVGCSACMHAMPARAAPPAMGAKPWVQRCHDAAVRLRCSTLLPARLSFLSLKPVVPLSHPTEG